MLAGLVVFIFFGLSFSVEASVPNCDPYYEGCATNYPDWPGIARGLCGKNYCMNCDYNCCCRSNNEPACCSAYNADAGGYSLPPSNCTCDEFHNANRCCWPNFPILCNGSCLDASAGCTGCNGSLCTNYGDECSNMSCCSPYNCRTDYDGSDKYCCFGTKCAHHSDCYADGTVSGSYKCSSGTWVSNISAPTVTTEIATVNVQNNTATLKGNIIATGGQNADLRGFVWDIDSGEPYANSWTEGTAGNYQYTAGTFSHQITINPGTIYYYKAKVHNSAGWSNLASTNERRVVIYTASGGQLSFLTSPITYTLSVSKAGTGSGTVNVNPPNTDYTADFTEDYDPGTSVTLTATPDAGSEFAGWSGDVCDGSSETSCVFTMDANKNVTATFNLSDTTSPTTGIKIFRGEEDVTTAGTWLRADNYTIKFEDRDQADGSGSNCENCTTQYSVYACDVGGTNCATSVISLTSRSPNWSFQITAGKTAPTYNLEGALRYRIYSGAKDMADNPSATQYRYINFDFTPPWTEIK